MTTASAPHVDVAHGRRLDGKVALVTGGSGQLGRRCAAALGGLGASIVLAHRDGGTEDAKAVLAALQEQDVTATVEPADLADSSAVAGLFDRVVERFGRVDIVIHTPGQVLKKPLIDVTDEEFESNIDANLRAAFHVMREAGRRVADGGRILTISTSITSVTLPGYGVYAGHKAATEHYVRALAKELGSRGITVNAVAPGPINSPFYFGVETEDSARLAASLSVAGRLGEWDEVVPLIAFLCTPDAHWITAQTIKPNGGMTA